jgi:predicted Zn finger-like uncharacterized protein
MVKECVNCSATYNIDDAKVPAKGVSFKCKKCDNIVYLKKEAGPKPALPQVPKTSSPELAIDGIDFDILEKCELPDGTKVEVVQFPKLLGSADLRTAEKLYYMKQAGTTLKMVKITLNDSHVRVEPGALYFMQGRLQIKASTGGGVLKGISRKLLSGESFFVNEIHGSGEIYLEPSFGHFMLHHLTEDQKGVVADKSLFYAGTAGLDIGAVMQKNISSAVFGGEGLFQTHIKGSGIAILYSPVPSSEICKIHLNNDKLWVDGNFALMRTEGVEFRAEKSSKSWLATSVSGEGLLQTFEGSGIVWIAPTQGIYSLLSTPEGIRKLGLPPGSSHTDTEVPKAKKRK